jgi:hypothetical protein
MAGRVTRVRSRGRRPRAAPGGRRTVRYARCGWLRGWLIPLHVYRGALFALKYTDRQPRVGGSGQVLVVGMRVGPRRRSGKEKQRVNNPRALSHARLAHRGDEFREPA